MDGNLSPQHTAILDALADHGPMAAEQLESTIGYPVWRRLNELERKGAIVAIVGTHTNRSGRQARKFRRA